MFCAKPLSFCGFIAIALSTRRQDLGEVVRVMFLRVLTSDHEIVHRRQFEQLTVQVADFHGERVVLWRQFSTVFRAASDKGQALRR